jgi:hypothetical protein
LLCPFRGKVWAGYTQINRGINAHGVLQKVYGALVLQISDVSHSRKVLPKQDENFANFS